MADWHPGSRESCKCSGLIQTRIVRGVTPAMEKEMKYCIYLFVCMKNAFYIYSECFYRWDVAISEWCTWISSKSFHVIVVSQLCYWMVFPEESQSWFLAWFLGWYRLGKSTSVLQDHEERHSKRERDHLDTSILSCHGAQGLSRAPDIPKAARSSWKHNCISLALFMLISWEWLAYFNLTTS